MISDQGDGVRDPVPGPRSTCALPEAWGLTDIGRVRLTNEDHFVIVNLSRSILVEESSLSVTDLPLFVETHWKLLLVADGLGGQPGGELASRLVAEELVGYLADVIPMGHWLHDSGHGVVEQEIRAAIEHCQAVIDRRAESDPGLCRMGMTVTMAFLARAYMVVGHVGDSRCYLLRCGKLTQLTRDHTVAQDKVEAGDTVGPADGHRLTGAVAGGLLGVTPDVFTVDLEADDVVMLCTDGLAGDLSDESIRDILEAGWSAERSCHLLVEAATNAGGRDNVTCVVARFPPIGARP